MQCHTVAFLFVAALGLAAWMKVDGGHGCFVDAVQQQGPLLGMCFRFRAVMNAAAGPFRSGGWEGLKPRGRASRCGPTVGMYAMAGATAGPPAAKDIFNNYGIIKHI